MKLFNKDKQRIINPNNIKVRDCKSLTTEEKDNLITKEMKMCKIIFFILFNITILSGFGQVKLVTVLDTVKVKSKVVSTVNNKIKKAVDNHFKYLKEESYCISNKNHIMKINIVAFDTINPDKYINLIDYTESDYKNNKYEICISIAKKEGQLIYQLNDSSYYYFYYKYRGWDIYIYTKLDIRFRNKNEEKYSIFPLKYRKYASDKEGKLPQYYLNYILDVRDYENATTLYKLDDVGNESD